MPAAIAIRPFASQHDYEGMIDYFFGASPEFLLGMGVDPLTFAWTDADWRGVQPRGFVLGGFEAGFMPFAVIAGTPPSDVRARAAAAMGRPPWSHARVRRIVGSDEVSMARR